MLISRSPTKTELHKIIRENYRQTFYDKEQQGIFLPFHLEREFRRYLTCGVPSFGMVRFQCSLCQKDKFVPYSCKGRTLCPSCTGRKMADTAKHLVSDVIPDVPIRQWVLSMPYHQRFLLATRPEFLRKVLAIYHRAVTQFYKREAKQNGLKISDVGVITVIQRFGGALNLNVHFHSLYTDGVFYEDGEGAVNFFEIRPSHEDVQRLTTICKERIIRATERELDNGDTDFSNFEIEAQSVQNRDEKSRLPIQIGKVCDPPFKLFEGHRCHYDDGFSLHAKVKIAADKRESLERLCRYIMRGPLSKERIKCASDGGVLLKLKSPYNDGTTHLKFTADQFIKRVIALIPPPRQNLIRYVGAFGARYKKRGEVTAHARPPLKEKKLKKSIYRTPWGDLLKHVFKEDVCKCDRCGSKLVLIASITSSVACRKILLHLNIEVEEFTVRQPQAPPELDFFSQDSVNF